jgi:hypothetical protein
MLAATPARRTALAAVGAAAVTAAILGGWTAASPEPIATASIGEPVGLGQVSVEVTGWQMRSGVAQEALEEYPGADAWLFFEVTMASATDSTERAQHDVLDLPDGLLLDPAEAEPHLLMLLRDGTHDPELQPGIPERVIFVWPVASESIGDSAVLPLRLIEFEQFTAPSTGELLWTESGVATMVDAPRDDQVGREFLAPDEETTS